MAAPTKCELSTSVDSLIKAIETECMALLRLNKGEDFLMKCYNECQRLQKIRITANASEIDAAVIKGLTQAILDYTFFLENQLVNEDFPESTSEERIANLLKRLSEPEEIIQKTWGTQKEIVKVFGEELYECLMWRKGALLYMYCCTIQEDERRVDRRKTHFSQCLQQGVQYLQKMLHVRRPLLEKRENIVAADNETFHLLSKGIFSDTHMLAMMYIGEMSYWYLKHLPAQTEGGSTSTDVFSPKETGHKMLLTYINAVRGPLRGKGWTCDRAEELMKELE